MLDVLTRVLFMICVLCLCVGFCCCCCVAFVFVWLSFCFPVGFAVVLFGCFVCLLFVLSCLCLCLRSLYGALVQSSGVCGSESFNMLYESPRR